MQKRGRTQDIAISKRKKTCANASDTHQHRFIHPYLANHLSLFMYSTYFINKPYITFYTMPLLTDKAQLHIIEIGGMCTLACTHTRYSWRCVFLVYQKQFRVRNGLLPRNHFLVFNYSLSTISCQQRNNRAERIVFNYPLLLYIPLSNTPMKKEKQEKGVHS